jgi:hypothetical protein
LPALARCQPQRDDQPPYVLNPASPASAAAKADNTVDNVEQVYIPNPTNGVYTVQVRHKGTLKNDQSQTNYQNVSIMLSGNVAQCFPSNRLR